MRSLLFLAGVLPGVTVSGEELPPAETAKPVERPYKQLSVLEKSVFTVTNQRRQARKKPALVSDPKLNQIALEHARNMAKQRKMAHVLDGKNLQNRLTDARYKFRAYAENVAYGYTSGKKVVAGWMKSPGHRKNLLDESDAGYTHVGVAAVRRPGGRYFYCQVFTIPAQTK